jgi:hypothetical protein
MDKNIKTVNRLIDRYGYIAYWVKLNKSMRCECVNPSTKEPDRECPRCLGTGHYISIHKIHLATREGKEYESDRAQSFAVTPKVIYVKGFVDFGKDDLIVDSESVYTIYTFQHVRGKQGKQAYTKAMAPDLKLNKAQFLKMFKELINGRL